MTTTVHPTPGQRKASSSHTLADTPVTKPQISTDLDAQVAVNQQVEQAVTDQDTSWQTAQAAVNDLVAKNQALSDLLTQQQAAQSKVISDTQTLLAQIQQNTRSLADTLNGVQPPTGG